MIGRLLARLLTAGVVDDPLLRYSEAEGFQPSDNYSETVSLAGLFSCQAAVAEMLEQQHRGDAAAARATNRRIVAELAASTGWEPKPIHHEMQSGILLAQAKSDSKRKADPLIIRNSFREAGVALTTYQNSYLRFSMPNSRLSEGNRKILQTALNQAVTV